MGTQIPVARFIRSLAAENRVLVIGGLAVIAHGMSRATKDADIWLDPADSPENWAENLLAVTVRFRGIEISTLPGWWDVSHGQLPGAVDDVGMVRLSGFECPLGIFRRPNQFGEQFATAAPQEAEALFARYADYAVCEKALGNPHPKVREMAVELLREFAANDDPFARDILQATRPGVNRPHAMARLGRKRREFWAESSIFD